MGMFDDITCEHALPGEPQPNTKRFQTKDFDCLMQQYTITKGGWLWKEGGEISFHGFVNFYTYTDDQLWFEYEAKFDHGRLVEIRPISIGTTERGGILPPK